MSFVNNLFRTKYREKFPDEPFSVSATTFRKRKLMVIQQLTADEMLSTYGTNLQFGDKLRAAYPNKRKMLRVLRHKTAAI